MPSKSKSSAAWAAACAAAVLLWQSLTVRYNYQGNWTGLYYAGAQFTRPAALAGERVYTFSGSAGYDGQFYHAIAHDPLLRAGTAAALDNPRVRWRRILVPGLAFLAAAGRPGWIDPAYRGVVLACVLLGAYWLSGYLASCGRHPAWGVAFALVPATLVSVDRMTVDVALAALTVAFALYAAREPSRKIYPVLALAPLVRETGILLIGGYALAMGWQRHWRRALAAAATALPFLAWALFVQLRTGPDPSGWLAGWPLQGLLMRTLFPVRYATPGRWMAVAAAADYIAVLAIWMALVMAVRRLIRNPSGTVETAAALFVVLAICLARPDAWADAYAFGRVLSPLLLLLALAGVADKAWWLLLPMALVLPRIGMQMGTQLPAIVKGLAGVR